MLSLLHENHELVPLRDAESLGSQMRCGATAAAIRVLGLIITCCISLHSGLRLVPSLAKCDNVFGISCRLGGRGEETLPSLFAAVWIDVGTLLVDTAGSNVCGRIHFWVFFLV